MPLDLADYREKAREAVRIFWGNRRLARERQAESGAADRGGRAGVTAGKNMDGFAALAADIVTANGLALGDLQLRRKVLTLPGFYRPTKLWDLLVVRDGELVAAMEFKSQVGPSFGNNFNNRTEEAVGTGHDLHVAIREGALGDQPRPFVGWLMLIEDAPASRSPVANAAPHFPVLPEFEEASYVERYHLLCKKLMQEGLYDAAALLTTARDAAETGEYGEADRMTGLETFVTQFAAHVAAAAARPRNGGGS